MAAGASRAENELTLSWLEHSLGYAMDRGQERLAGLLVSVLVEVAFEMEPPTEGSPEAIVEQERERHAWA